MDFFTAQDNARRKTGRLVVLLIAAVVALIAVTTVAITLVLYFMNHRPGELTVARLLGELSPGLVVTVALGVVGLVAMGAYYKRYQLRRGGGRVVAEALGGREIYPDTGNPSEQRILNVVEEMAIASGMPVPTVYVMQETGINAFAAGFDTRDAVIGMTQGAIDTLSRDELQGVVAHEFSHILHGDMRLNMRLISLLHGVLLIGLLGHLLLRSMALRGSSARRSSNDNNKGAALIMALGAALAVIGYAGTFFGNWIKAAVSRQREYLADASAVQYTRNPEGIGQALIRIGAHAQGARLDASRASEYSHLFFGQGLKLGFISRRLLSTHPPLDQRIKRVLPGWSGEFDTTPLVSAADDGPRAAAPSTAGLADTARASATMTGASARAAMAAMGNPGPRHLGQAQKTLEALPGRLREAARDPYAVRALMYGLLLDQDAEVRKRQLKALEQAALPDVYRAVMSHAGEVLMLDDALRLPLVELALPALKNLSTEQARHFRQCLKQLIDADGKVSLFEWTLYHWLVHHLDLDATRQGRGARKHKLKDCQPECQVLLSVLAGAGQDDPAEIAAALAAAEQELPFVLQAQEGTGDMQALGQAVNRLRGLKAQQKPALLQAMARCIEHSGHIEPAEAELFRAIADMLDCPVPPLLVDE